MISLIFFQTKISLTIAAFLFLVGYSLNSFSKNKISKWGNERFKLDQILMKSLLEIFSSVREIKIFNKKNFFVSSFIQKYSPLGYLSVKANFLHWDKQSYEILTLIAFVFWFLSSTRKLFQ